MGVLDAPSLYSKGLWDPIWSGAVGDGTTNDTAALRAAIATGKTVVLNPLKTYLVRGCLQLQVGQELMGNGATVKRDAQATTTTATPANNTTTVYTFASAAGFKVGDNIAFADAGVTQANLVATTSLSTNNPQITNINGNTVTVNVGPNCTIAGSSNVYSSYTTIGLAADTKVRDLQINGNLANWPWARWECVGEFYGGSAHRALVSGCHVTNGPGEGFVMNGNYLTAVDCVFDTLKGNGIHLSGAAHPVVDNCTILNPNGDTNLSHVMGCVGWSNTITDATVVNCFLSGGRSGIGAVDSSDNSDCTIANNTIRSSTTYGIDIVATAGNLLIRGNRVYSCGSGANGAINVGTGTATGIQIVGNLFSANSVNVGQSNDVTVLDNQFLSGSNLTLLSTSNSRVAGNTFVGGKIIFSNLVNVTIEKNLVDLAADTTNVGIGTSGSNNVGVTIRNNTIIGGAQNITIANGTSDFAIIGNTCRGGNGFGIYINVTGPISRSVIMGNSVSVTSNSLSSWIGIRCNANAVTIKGNFIAAGSAGSANYGICITDKNLIDGNATRGTFSVADIAVTAASTSSTVTNNVTTGAISDLGTTTNKVNNTVMS